MQPKLAILAGGGVLPRRLAEAAQGMGRPVFVLAFNGQTEPKTIEGFEHHWVRLGAAGEAIDTLKKNNVEELVMAGHIRRPSIAELMPDWRAAKLFAKAGLAAAGDDGLLTAVRRELEGEGFRLIGAQDILTGLLTPAGTLGQHVPDTEAERDINRGIGVLRALAPQDVGQAAVVQQGLVLGIEAAEGTAALIRRAGELRREGAGGVLVKLAKPQQDKLLDLPTIGVDTIQQAKEAGLRGIALEAGRSLLLDRAETVAKADAAGLFLIGLELKA